MGETETRSMTDFYDKTHGKWLGILSQIGVDVSGRHGPCPLCGGKDRFRFDDKHGDGDYYCNGCGAGKGMMLYQQITGLDWRSAAKEIEKMLNEIKTIHQKPKKDPRPYLRRISSGLVPITESPDVLAYLKSRNLPISNNIKAHSGIDYYDVEGKKIGTFSAMVGKVVDSDLQPVTLHVTYLENGGKADVPNPKKLMPVVKPFLGSAIRLFPYDGVLGVAEGIETALACYRNDGVPTWSAISDQGLANFKVPDDVKTLVIYGDYDESFAGQAAAYALAKKECRFRQVYVCIPNKVGDWADY